MIKTTTATLILNIKQNMHAYMTNTKAMVNLKIKLFFKLCFMDRCVMVKKMYVVKMIVILYSIKASEWNSNSSGFVNNQDCFTIAPRSCCHESLISCYFRYLGLIRKTESREPMHNKTIFSAGRASTILSLPF